MIPFNTPLIVGTEQEYIEEVIKSQEFRSDGHFTRKCNMWIEKNTGTKTAILTTSCTHAIEMASLLLDIKHGDEVIIPSFTFVSTANPFVLRGARIAFVDIRPDTMNIDETKIEAAINKRTKAIVPVHYSGVGCDMDTIMKIADKYNLYVIEDASQSVMSSYKEKIIGSIGHIGCYSFHETKNLHCGEGGAILINNEEFLQRANILKEKGTNRSRFLRGKVDKYTWVASSSSYLPSELNAAFLLAQLEKADDITNKRLMLWETYQKLLKPLADKRKIEIPIIPEECDHNGHIFYIKVEHPEDRSSLINYLKLKGIESVFHYIPLHLSRAGIKHGSFIGTDKYTTRESERLIRLPMFYELATDQVEYICNIITDFVN